MQHNWHRLNLLLFLFLFYLFFLRRKGVRQRREWRGGEKGKGITRSADPQNWKAFVGLKPAVPWHVADQRHFCQPDTSADYPSIGNLDPVDNINYSTVGCRRTVCRRTTGLEFYLKIRTTPGCKIELRTVSLHANNVLFPGPACVACMCNIHYVRATSVAMWLEDGSKNKNEIGWRREK